MALHAAARVQPVPVPQEMRSTDFTVTVDGKPVDVAHAAANYSYASFDVTGPVNVEITAAQPGFWDRGVDVQPWRLGIRPRRAGQTLRFRLAGPAKLSIARPRDFLNHATMLFLFAGTPPPQLPAASTQVHVFEPGLYKQSLTPQSGETYYLKPGAFLLGSLNLFNVENVKVLGRGTIVYDGPQDPNADEGWMQKPDWHCVGTNNAHNIEIDGLTCIVRSRTWSIQLKDSSGVIFDDLRVMGGNPGNANQDGIDWIGTSDGVVRHAFFRASDDVIALMGNWDGYTDADMLRPGHDVSNIVVEDSELSTSISNIVRAGWPRKTFNSRNFTLRNSDVLHAGIGACGQSFGLLGFWGANGARGEHTHYLFENVFLDDWYSLVQMEQAEPALRDFIFHNIWALDQPPLVGSSIAGNVQGVVFDNVKHGQQRIEQAARMPLTVASGAAQPEFTVAGPVVARFQVEPEVIAAGAKATFTAEPVPHARYTWLFGDGTEAHGRRVTHRFADAEGTELDGKTGAGRFRVLLHVEGREDQQDWAARGVVVVANWHEAVQAPVTLAAGLTWRLYAGTWTELPDLGQRTAVFAGDAAGLTLDPHGFTRYAGVWDGFIEVPADGGYTFHATARDGARVVIDGVEVARTGPPFAQVCGAPGNAVRYDRGSLGLRAGLHAIHVEGLHSVSDDVPRLLWEGPGVIPGEVPPSAYRHVRQDAVSNGTN